MVGDIKHIVIIESLIDEKLTGKELYDDCIRKKINYQEKPFTHKYYHISTKNELIELLKFYQINASYLNGGLLFHFEMHGTENLTGLVLSNGDLIVWKELIELFRPINIITINNLFITMATCYGRHLYKGVDPYQKSPYSGYISASKEINPIEILEKFTLLFERLIDNGNLVEAYLIMQKTESNFYYKDSERTFKESYQSIYNKLTQNEKYKEKFIEESKKYAKEMGQPIADYKTSELIFQKALKDIYEKQKEAFEFKNCN